MDIQEIIKEARELKRMGHKKAVIISHLKRKYPHKRSGFWSSLWEGIKSIPGHVGNILSNKYVKGALSFAPLLLAGKKKKSKKSKRSGLNKLHQITTTSLL